MTSKRAEPASLDFPSDLEVVVTRDFDAPIELVFDVLTKPEHLAKTMAPFGETMKVCTVDLRVGGEYHFVFVTKDGVECSFRGTFLEVDSPRRTVETWRFEGWPGVEAVETEELQESDGMTTLTQKLAFRDQAGRDHMTKYDGLLASIDNLEGYLRSLLEDRGAISEE